MQARERRVSLVHLQLAFKSVYYITLYTSTYGPIKLFSGGKGCWPGLYMSSEKDAGLSSRLARFQELKNKREEAATLNLASAKAEDAQIKSNPRTLVRLERKKAKAEAYLTKQAASSSGVDLERQNNLTYTIEDAERWKTKVEAKEARRDPGLVDYGQLTRRKYEKLVDKLNPALLEGRTKEEAKKQLAEAIKEEQRQRTKFSRRRKYEDIEDVTYINERNARFNRKAARAYDEFTEDLREGVERGTT